MKETSTIFTGPMVRAILAGRKTQTRRIVKPQPPQHVKTIVPGRFYDGTPGYGFENERGDKWKSPYGGPGDRLWVRETWKTGKYLDCYSPASIARQCEEAGYKTVERGGSACPILYLADEHHRKWSEHDIEDFGDWGKTRVSIHMPRWASRITLEVTGVRCERLNAISEADAIAEGTPRDISPVEPTRMPYPSSYIQGQFAALWESINGEGSWEADPWVWVVSFQKVDQ